MLSVDNDWTMTFVFAALAVGFALAGLGLDGFYPGAAPLVSSGLLVASLGCTSTAFTRLALRVRRIELENEGLIEEISREFDRMKDKIEIFTDALAQPRSIRPEEIERAPVRRVTIE